MTLAFSQPPSPDSPLARLDARWRLAGLLVLLAATALPRALLSAAAALAVALLLAALARLPPRWFAERLGTAAAALALFALPLPLLLRGDGPEWRLGFVVLSAHGARVALLLTLKAAALLTLSLVLLAAGPLDATLKAAHSLRLPGLLVQLALLTYRYLFVLADELTRLRRALRVRGYRNRASRHSYRTVGQVCGTLLARGVERAERVHHAMRCRGFDGRFRSLADFRTTPADVLAFALLLLAAAGVVALDRAGG